MDDALTDVELAAIERRCAEASPGPWQAFVEGRDHVSGDTFIMIGLGDERGADMYVSQDDERGRRWAAAQDLDFIAAARQDIPRLIAEVRRLRSRGL